MIIITPEAAKQIRKSAEITNSQNMHLRIGVRREDDGTYTYGMGFDEMGNDDVLLASEGINIIVANASKDFLMGATIDFVEIGADEHRFIFVNPNDPTHTSASTQGNNEPKSG